MERTNTFEEMTKPWMKVQQDMMEQWRTTMASVTPYPFIGPMSWLVEFWKTAIYEGLTMQNMLANTWKDWVCATDANIPEISQGAEQSLNFYQGVIRSQMQVWEDWFALLQGRKSPVAERSRAG